MKLTSHPFSHPFHFFPNNIYPNSPNFPPMFLSFSQWDNSWNLFSNSMSWKNGLLWIELDLDQMKERDDMLSGFFQQLILKASNRNSPFSQKQTNLQSNPSKDETKNNTWMVVWRKEKWKERKSEKGRDETLEGNWLEKFPST